MVPDSKFIATRLAHRTMLSLHDRAGERIECCAGCLWLTQEGDPRDIVLEAGDGFMLDRPGTALVYALSDAHLTVRRPTVQVLPAVPRVAADQRRAA